MRTSGRSNSYETRWLRPWCRQCLCVATKEMASAVALVQGASRGLGLQFCRSLLQQRPGTHVIATCRDPQSAVELLSLKSANSDRLEIEKIDLAHPEGIQEVAEKVKQNGVKKLDLLINCAGMLHPSGKGETSLRDVTLEGLSATVTTNAFGPLLMAKHFAPLLTKGSGAYGSKSHQKQHSGIIVNVSARVGSISDNIGLGGWYSYRMSKTALNMATKNLSIELARGRSPVVCVSIHPGTVNTDLSRPYHRSVPKDKIFTPEYSAECILGIVDGLTMGDTGKFLAWDGQIIPH
ncbi:C-signal-like isoform X2 [Asterias amurensis]|uniref:C-signal-like isoform X2 n=1 Tax=Asterias amurensis TaxID=7602 RepID=UPI003AB55683